MSDSVIKPKILYPLLVTAGVIPFFVTAIAPLISLETIPLFGDVKRAGALYGLVIVSFMAGIHWGICVANNSLVNSSRATMLMIASNVYAVLPWLLYLSSGHSTAFYLSLIIAFTLIFIGDRSLFQKAVISRHYYRTRKWVTTAVLICLSINLIS